MQSKSAVDLSSKRTLESDEDRRRVKSRTEEDNVKSDESNPSEVKVARTEGESQGEISKDMDLDAINEGEWEGVKDAIRQEKIPLLMIEGSNQDRGIQTCRIQDMVGEYYVWRSPSKRNHREALGA